MRYCASWQTGQKKTKQGDDHKLLSMPAKLLWFYHPNEMTMYDRYTAKGLEMELRCKVRPQNYLEKFNTLFAAKAEAIALS